MSYKITFYLFNSLHTIKTLFYMRSTIVSLLCGIVGEKTKLNIFISLFLLSRCDVNNEWFLTYFIAWQLIAGYNTDIILYLSKKYISQGKI